MMIRNLLNRPGRRKWIRSVELAVAISIPDKRWGEGPPLLVNARAGEKATACGNFTHFSAGLPSWQVPERIMFVDQFSLGAAG
jgi:acyl-CoA synthetase (AMP-forming)/AMP-acid ligase II